MITETFNLISQLKYIKKEKLIIDITDELLMKKYYLKYRIYKNKMNYMKWRTEVIYNSITFCEDIEASCKTMLKNINTING